jgi:hypothetical protein
MACQRRKRAVFPAWQPSNGACVLIFFGETGLDLSDDAFSDPIVRSWARLSSFVAQLRSAVGRAPGL